MTIEDIIYNTTRELTNIEDKLRITTIFLFCKKLSAVELAELLYTDTPEKYIVELNREFPLVDLHINFKNRNVKNAFYKTLEEIRKKWDEDGFLKALYEKDEFALICAELADFDFEELA